MRYISKQKAQQEQTSVTIVSDHHPACVGTIYVNETNYMLLILFSLLCNAIHSLFHRLNAEQSWLTV